MSPKLSKVANGLAAFFAVFLFMGSFVLCCLRCIKRVEQWEESLGLEMLFFSFLFLSEQYDIVQSIPCLR